MNENTKQLAEQAIPPFSNSTDPTWQITESELQEFADLIVSKCYDIVTSNPNLGTSLAGRNMKDYFGVK
jgi:hypothetical protein